MTITMFPLGGTLHEEKRDKFLCRLCYLAYKSKNFQINVILLFDLNKNYN